MASRSRTRTDAPPTLRPRDRAAWRRWLARHHGSHPGLYLVIAKKHLLERSPGLLSYDDALDEALCFGWIDGHVRYFDEDWRAIRFTPRRDDSIWSERNKARVLRLIREGCMMPAGLRAVAVAKKSGEWTAAQRRAELVEPPALSAALAANGHARSFWRTLAPSHRKQWIFWVSDAKRPETVARRIAAVVRECAQHRKPGATSPATTPAGRARTRHARARAGGRTLRGASEAPGAPR